MILLTLIRRDAGIFLRVKKRLTEATQIELETIPLIGDDNSTREVTLITREAMPMRLDKSELCLIATGEDNRIRRANSVACSFSVISSSCFQAFCRWWSRFENDGNRRSYRCRSTRPFYHESLPKV